MPPVVGQILILLLLIILNGVFSMSEIAIISARKTRLQQRAEEGDTRAATALDLANTPNRFLSTIQIGITLISVFTGAFGGATLSGPLADALGRVPWLAPYAGGLSLVLVVVLTTYISLVIGELVPKRLALANPEGIALAVSKPMNALSRITLPIVRVLSLSTEVVLRLLGSKPSQEPPVTEDEIRVLFQEGTEAGIFEEAEQDLVESILLLDDRRVSALMTPRPDIVWLDVNDPPEEIKKKIVEGNYSRFPVADGNLDDILGEVQSKNLLAQLLSGEELSLRAAIQTPLYVPEIMSILRVLDAFRQANTQLALVIDEYGSVQGLLTLNDILSAIVGELPSIIEPGEPEIVQREDGSWLVDAMVSFEEFKEYFGIEELPGEDQGLYQTLGGFVTMQIGGIPKTADYFEWGGFRFEVLDMDGPRVDKMLLRRIEVSSPAEPQVPKQDTDTGE
ncbi:MAG: HlyC/CorC family transporter [Chloroflexi bacterium]|jgi:putative hemolysin|nr:HlyC/CorC family transporter [Chloroflexota bacterium]